MSTIKANALTGVTTNSDLTLSGNGTGGVTVSDYFILSKGSDIASATALALGTDGNAFDVTGTTTITSIGTQGIGSHVTLHFDGALTFTHHATDLILPGAANITTATGDVAVMHEYASGDWRCISYTKASGKPITLQQTKGSDIASATSLTLGTGSNLFDVTGTTTITSIGTQGVGSHITLHFDSALTFTHHSTDLILPGAANITTATGDIAVMYEYASGDWRCISYSKASGQGLVSSITADAVTAISTNTDLSLSGSGTGGVKVTDYLVQTKGSDIASATALTLGKDGNAFDVTGTTTITSIGTQGIGSHITLQFDGILTFTHHATDLILPGAANITTAVGDVAVMYEYASGDWRCVSYTRADGTAIVGGGAVDSQTFLSPGTWTKPSEGSQIRVQVWGGGGGGGTSTPTAAAGGAGGGGYNENVYEMSDLGATETVTIGAGGTAPDGNGGTSSVGSILLAYGGGGGLPSTNPATGGIGGGGGGFSQAGNPGSGPPSDYAKGGDNKAVVLDGLISHGAGGGGHGGVSGTPANPGGGSVYGGGGGGGGRPTPTSGGSGGSSLFGGGGGGGGQGGDSGGISLFGGNGGHAGSPAPGADGIVPGGGGGSGWPGLGGDGGAGKVIITTH